MADQIIDTNETVETIYEEKARADEAKLREEERDLHDRSISENYRRLFEESVTAGDRSSYVTDTVYAPVRPAEEERVSATPAEETPAMVRTEVGADNKARIGSYHRPPASAHARLFEDVTYVKGGYMSGRPAVEEYAPAAAEEVYAPAAPEEAVYDEAIPTPMTMRHYDPERTAEAQKEGVHFWAALSAKTKLLLAAVAAAIVICFMVICINTAVLGSVNADIASRRLELDRLGKTYRQIEDRIEEVTDPDHVDGWALENGMVKD